MVHLGKTSLLHEFSKIKLVEEKKKFLKIRSFNLFKLTIFKALFLLDCMCLCCICVCMLIDSIMRRNNLLKELAFYTHMLNNLSFLHAERTSDKYICTYVHMVIDANVPT